MTSESYWVKNAPNVPRVWSSSSLSTLSACPRRFQLTYVEGWEQKGENLDFTFGSAFHSCMEFYWLQRVLGEDHESALDEAVWCALVASHTLPQPIRPKQKAKTRRGLVTAVVWYLDHYSTIDDPSEILRTATGSPGIELKFTFLLPLKNADGEDYQVQGYLDNIRDFCGSYTAWDFKTTAGAISPYYLKKFQLNIQNAIYTMAARVLTDENYTQFLADVVSVDTRERGLSKKMEVAFFDRVPVPLTEPELDEYIKDIMALIKDAERYAEASYYPKKTDSCTFCQFADICSKAPELRPPFLKTDFIQNRRTVIEERK